MREIEEDRKSARIYMWCRNFYNSIAVTIGFGIRYSAVSTRYSKPNFTLWLKERMTLLLFLSINLHICLMSPHLVWFWFGRRSSGSILFEKKNKFEHWPHIKLPNAPKMNQPHDFDRLLRIKCGRFLILLRVFLSLVYPCLIRVLLLCIGTCSSYLKIDVFHLISFIFSFVLPTFTLSI